MEKRELISGDSHQPISDHDTYDSLLPRLANLNGRLLVDVLRGIQAGTVRVKTYKQCFGQTQGFSCNRGH